MAELSTGSTEIVALRHGYSGRSMLAQSLTGALDLARAADAGRRASSTRVVALLLPLPAEADVPLLRHRLREGHRGAHPHDDDRPRRRASSRSRSRASAASSRRRRSTSRSPSRSSGSTAASSSATRSRRASAARAARCGASSTGASQPDIMTMAKGIANGLPARRHDRDAGDRGRVEGADDLDLRRQPGLARGRERDDPDHRGGRPRRQRGADGRDPARRARGAPARASRRSIGDVRGMGLMQASSSSRTRRPATARPIRP